jgi:polyphenol oxidase
VVGGQLAPLEGVGSDPGLDRLRSDVDGAPVAAASQWSMIGGAQVIFTDRAMGDMAGAGPDVEARRRAVVDLPWTVLRQVHGTEVVVIDEPGPVSGQAGDAMVTAVPGAALAILTADCAPVAFSSPEGVVGVAHAGWRGLRAGVLEATVTALRGLGAGEIEAVLGPCIHPCCYEFGPAELAGLVEQFGPTVESRDRAGRPALDVPAAVEVVLAGLGVALVGEVACCTGCSGSHHSWRVQRDQARQATVVWR